MVCLKHLETDSQPLQNHIKLEKITSINSPIDWDIFEAPRWATLKGWRCRGHRLIFVLPAVEKKWSNAVASSCRLRLMMLKIHQDLQTT